MKTRMRPDQLTHFQTRLVDKRCQLEDAVGRCVLYGKDLKDDASKDLGDQALNAYTREFQFELGSGDRRLLRDVLAALRKLDEGGFGECERCAEEISEKRLEALPFARYCIECQRHVEREERAVTG